MRLIKHAIVVAMGVSFVFSYFDSTVTLANDESVEEVEEPSGIAPVWDDTIRQWAPEIIENAGDFGLDPDLVAAVVLVESNGYSGVVSYAGAVGLMGIMPQGPGFEFRPNATHLGLIPVNPSRNFELFFFDVLLKPSAFFIRRLGEVV